MPGLRVERLLWRLAGGTALILIVAALLPAMLPWMVGMTAVRAVSFSAIRGGAIGVLLASGLLALTGEIASAAMLRARRRPQAGLSAKHFQGSVVPLLAAMAGWCAWVSRPILTEPAPQDSFVLAGILLTLAFVALVAERTVAAIRPAVLPEVAGARALALLPVLALAAAACGQIAIGSGIAGAWWVARLVCLALLLIAAELALRALARWFLPASQPAAARAAVDSLLAQMVLGSIGRGGIAAPIRAQLGIDFSRSWALLYLRAAALPALGLTALLCWALTGLVMIDLDQRGVYQRLGAPVGVLRPGLHLILPWPLGVARRVELGAVHEISIGGEQRAMLAAEKSPAEAPPPVSANRLWDQPHPGEVSYLIASETEGRQSFQTVNADIRVLYRVGTADTDAVRAATLVVDPTALIRQVAGRRVARLLAGRTLAAMLGERREAIAEELRAAIADDLAPFSTGIEIVGVVVEAIHPPAGAAAAYHAVQAAEINSRMAVAEAQGRAKSAANEARQQVRQLQDSATAQAAETVQAATTESIRFSADQKASTAGGKSFLAERYFANLVTGLARAPLTILDDRLAGTAAPTIDLRSFAAPVTTPLDDPD